MTNAKRTVIRLARKYSLPEEVWLRWENEDGPTAEEIVETTVGLIRRHWLGEGDTITVTEE